MATVGFEPTLRKVRNDIDCFGELMGTLNFPYALLHQSSQPLTKQYKRSNTKSAENQPTAENDSRL